jgi:hypothetical protein
VNFFILLTKQNHKNLYYAHDSMPSFPNPLCISVLIYMNNRYPCVLKSLNNRLIGSHTYCWGRPIDSRDCKLLATIVLIVVNKHIMVPLRPKICLWLLSSTVLKSIVPVTNMPLSLNLIPVRPLDHINRLPRWRV